MVLHRGFSRGGFVFFTNYNSRKAVEMLANPRAAIVFHWPLLERQVRAEGRVEKLTRAESDRYFRSRPRESRLSAWASPQSAEIPDRAFLEARVRARARDSIAGKRVPRPPFWGGFRLSPRRDRVLAGTALSASRPDLLREKGPRLAIVRLAP